MDQIFGNFGSYWAGQKANTEVNSVGNDLNSVGNNIGEGTSWLVNKVKGTIQKPLPELLKDHDLPEGIFPKNATHYEFDEKTGKLRVHVSEICEVFYKDSSVLRFFTTITGHLEKGKLTEIEGMKTKVMIWVKVSAMTSDGSKFVVTAGIKKSRSKAAYEILRDGVIADKF